jgi:hypothetical protein
MDRKNPTRKAGDSNYQRLLATATEGEAFQWGVMWFGHGGREVPVQPELRPPSAVADKGSLTGCGKHTEIRNQYFS